METLPEELLVHIFSYLGFKDLANVKTGSKRVQNVICVNSKRMKKYKAVPISVAAKLDSNGKKAVEIVCGDPEEHRILCTDTEMIAGDPFYMKWMEPKEKILEKDHYKKKFKKHLDCLEAISRTIADGRPFGPENPLPSTSMESEFQETLLFFLKRFNLDLFSLDEDDRKFTSEELGIILTVIKATAPTVGWMRRTTKTIDDQYMEIIKELRCNYLMFCGSCDEGKNKETGEYSVNNRILQVLCEELCFYDHTIVSNSTMLLLLKQWKDGIRQIKNYTYHHELEGLDWFPLVENDFKVIKYPEDIIWTCNATIELKTFTITREIDEWELDFYYYGTYLEIRGRPKYVPPPETAQTELTTGNDEEEEEEDLTFGLFD